MLWFRLLPTPRFLTTSREEAHKQREGGDLGGDQFQVVQVAHVHELQERPGCADLDELVELFGHL